MNFVHDWFESVRELNFIDRQPVADFGFVAVVYLEQVELFVKGVEVAQKYFFADILIVVVPRGITENFRGIFAGEYGIEIFRTVCNAVRKLVVGNDKFCTCVNLAAVKIRGNGQSIVLFIKFYHKIGAGIIQV